MNCDTYIIGKEMKTYHIRDIINQMQSIFTNNKNPYSIIIDTLNLDVKGYTKENIFAIKNFISGIRKKNKNIKEFFKESVIKTYTEKVYLYFFSLFSFFPPLSKTTLVLYKTKLQPLNPIYKKHIFIP